MLENLWVHWAATPDSDTCERAMLTAFAADLSPESRAALPGEADSAPFANLRTGTGFIKRHCITSATGERQPVDGAAEYRSRAPARAISATAGRVPASSTSTPPRAVGGDTPTQRITEKDFEAGRIRLPARSKKLLPGERADVQVRLRGRRLRARWDPRMGPPERSGVLAFGRGALDGLVDVEDVLDVDAGTDDNDVDVT